MGSHKLIEPSQLNQMRMDRVSSIYEIYHYQLQHTTSYQASEATRRYCLSHHSSILEDQLATLEFLYMNEYMKELESILHDGLYNQELLMIYRIMYNRKKTPLKEGDLNWLSALTFSHPSLKCLHLFTMVYAFYDIKQYTGLDKYIDDIYEALLTINEPLFHYYMVLRFDELLFQHYWKTNSVVLAKKHAYKYINSGLAPGKSSMMYHNLALCDTFTDYNLAIDNAHSALEIAVDYELSHPRTALTNHTIPFISAIHKKTNGVLTPDPIETAHLAIARKKNEQAKQILSKLDELTPFQETYLGAATKDPYMLKNAKSRFIHDYGDLFFAQLPELYLKELVKVV
ncbi:AimR family lysis-lysogeny pheromone receptor [Halobacillus salinarum]|uniref:AimR family lysis-lysogeny pheromone receptor n=1 Tax=Halobacillus salinarum TaxID=2932257 RepID=A0ABY4EQT7_9BACI|nr:AimR family lysis-lysogeny pheromone receptor [Halobacillus salinarum]UOQ44471.1 AimR family lysis-lysogeny pheromone receptor [Halobacillus salinarum]